MNDDYSPSLVFSRFLRFWWLIVLLMILGGAIGVLISRTHRPIYESRAEITTALDYSLLGKLTDTEEDQVYTSVGQLLNSTVVQNEVLNQVKARNIGLSDKEVIDSLVLSRQENVWLLNVRLNDPKMAQEIDQIWSSSAMKALTDMKTKAVVGYNSQQYLNSLVDCMQQSVVAENPLSDCGSQNVSELQKEIDRVIDDPDSQLVSSSILLLHLSFELTTEPTLPAAPVLLSQNISALTGMITALALGIFFLSIDFRPRIPQTGK